jgi:hypothetical protein
VSSAVKVAEIDKPIENVGELTFSHADNEVPDCECDRLVYSNSILYAASFVTTPTQMKAVRAILHAKGKKVYIRARGITCRYPSKVGTCDDRGFDSPDMTACDKGYSLWVERLDFGKVHCTVISKDQNLIMYVSPESVWARLNDSEHFETPLLREWMPYVTGKLIAKTYLRECRCYRANAAILDIKKREHLDEIVTSGLKDGYISIP